MALLLIKATSASHPTDLTKDLRGCYKRGDIVEVLDDAKHDGDLVANPIMPPFVLVRITGVTKAQLDRLMQPQTTIAINGRGEIVTTTIRRRRHRLLIDATPLAIRNAIGADRYIEVSWAQVRNYLEDKETGLTEGPNP